MNINQYIVKAKATNLYMFESVQAGFSIYLRENEVTLERLADLAAGFATHVLPDLTDEEYYGIVDDTLINPGALTKLLYQGDPADLDDNQVQAVSQYFTVPAHVCAS